MAFTYVQQSNVSTTGTGTVFSAPAVTTTAGNHLFVHLMWSATAATTASVTDTAGNTYIPVSASMSSGGANSQWFYCLNALGHASNVITQTLSVGRAYRSVRVMEFSGTSPVFEQLVNAKSTTGTTLTSGAFNTAAAGLVLVGQSNFNGETVGSFSANYTSLPVTFSYSKEGYRITTGPLTGETITYTGNASTNRTMDILTLVEGGGEASGVLDSTLADAILSASGEITHTGAFSASLGNALMSSVGSASSSPSGSFSTSLNNATMAAIGQLLDAGEFSSSLAGATASFMGNVAQPNTGAFSAALAGVVMNAYGYEGEVPPPAANRRYRPRILRRHFTN